MDTNLPPEEKRKELVKAIATHNHARAMEILEGDMCPDLARVAIQSATITNNIPLLAIAVTRDLPKDVCSDNLIHAASRGFVQAVDLLLPHSDVSHNHFAAIREAAGCGSQEIFDRLLPHWPAPYKNIELVAASAASGGHLTFIKQCLELKSFDLRNSLLSASSSNHPHVVAFVLPFCSDEVAVDAIFVANIYDNDEIVDQLWPTVRTFPQWEQRNPHHNYVFDPLKKHLARLKQAWDHQQELTLILDNITQSRPSVGQKM